MLLCLPPTMPPTPSDSYVCPNVQRDRRIKFIRFVICQTIAFGVVFGSGALGISQHFTDESVIWTFKLVTISAAIATAVIPILFYALPSTLPRS
jgi:hypothetical protein